jgi:hypothetical protein
LQSKKYFILVLLCLLNCFAKAQNSQTILTPAEYNDKIVGEQYKIQQKIFDYTSYAVHSENIEEIIAKRLAVILQIDASIASIQAMPEIKKDGNLKKEAVDVFVYYKTLFELDFKDSDELAKNKNNSYNDLKKYYASLDKATKKMQKAVEDMAKAQQKFADKNAMKIVASENPNTETFKKISEFNEYQRAITMEIMKPTFANKDFLGALEAQKVKESHREKIVETATEAIENLKAMKAFNKSAELKNSAIALATFYKNFAKKQYVKMVEISNKKPAERTQKDIDFYNQAVKDFNEQSQKYNADYLNISTKISKSIVPNVTLKWN